MWQALRAALKHKDMLLPALEFVLYVQEVTADGKLDKDERKIVRSKVMKFMWAMVKQAEKQNS